MFSQHDGIHGVSTIHVPNDYVFGLRSDVAVVKLSSTVTGIEPSAINTSFRLAPGSLGLLVGFGLSGTQANDNGIKNYGYVTTSTCTQVPANEHCVGSSRAPSGPRGRTRTLAKEIPAVPSS